MYDVVASRPTLSHADATKNKDKKSAELSVDNNTQEECAFHGRFQSILRLSDGPLRRKLLVECSEMFVKSALRDGVTIINELHQQVYVCVCVVCVCVCVCVCVLCVCMRVCG